MVVDHIKDHAETQLVRLVDERPELVRCSVQSRWRKEINSLIAPIERTWEFGDGHNLQQRYSYIRQPRQDCARSDPRTFPCECADVHFVDHLAVDANARPVRICPSIVTRIHDLRGAVWSLRLKTGSRIREQLF